MSTKDKKFKCECCKATLWIYNPQNHPIENKKYCSVCWHNKYREECREARRKALKLK